jgi:hypothetical protein
MTKSAMTNKWTLSAGRFDGHGGAPEQYRQHRPMQHVQGYSGSHWTPASGYVSPQQPPGQQANKQQSTNTPKKVALLMAMAMRRYVTARISQWRRSRASLEATGRRHRASIMSDNINWTWLQCFFLCFHRQNRRKRSQVNAKTLVFYRGMTYQSKQKGLTKVSIYCIWGI